MKKYSPALTIPMHYLIRGTNTTLSTLQPADEFMKSIDKSILLESAHLSITASQYERNDEIVALF